jgi:hypothetical protein
MTLIRDLHHPRGVHPHRHLFMILLIVGLFFSQTFWKLSCQSPFPSVTTNIIDVPLSANVKDDDEQHYTSGSQVPSHSWNICHQWAVQSNTPTFSMPRLWQSLRTNILGATIQSQHAPPPEPFVTAVTDLFAWYTYERLHQSLVHPAPHAVMRSILQILQDYPTTHKPLEIYVMGGSVTAGTYCTGHSLRSPNRSITLDMGSNEACAWPSRLQVLLTHGVFQEDSRIRVTNLANGGYSSDVSAVVLEYQLYRQDHPEIGPPHIIIWSHAANDAWGIFSNAQVADMQARFVEAALHAHGASTCHDNNDNNNNNNSTTTETAMVPLVILLDDFRATTPLNILESSVQLYQTTAWYQLMSLSFTNVVGHTMLGQFDEYRKIFSGRWVYHLGLFFHVGVAWVVLFGLLEALTTACQVEYEAAQTNTLESPTTTVAADLPLQYIPSLQQSQVNKSYYHYSVEWQSRTKQAKLQCRSDKLSSLSSTTQPLINNTNITSNSRISTTPQCEYAWIRHGYDNVDKDVTHFLQPYISHNEGWSFEHYDRKNIQPGWYARQEQAHFALTFDPVSIPIRTLTLLYVKSYNGTEFTNAQMNLTTSVVQRHLEKTSTLPEESATHAILNGTMDLRFTVPFVHRHALPGMGAGPGDAVQLNFTMISGHRFMIVGMALCADP